jgi:hypothetical protein
MTPQTITIEKERQDEPRQEPFVRQVEDHSLPAQQVLTDQQEDRTPVQPPVLFVP